MTNKIVILQNSVELYEHYINDEKWEKTLSFPKGGLTYNISNGTIKFFAFEDYLYRNCLMSMQLPIYIVDEKDGIDDEYSDIGEIVDILDEIFPTNDIDAELEGYLTKREAELTYQPIGDYVTTYELDEVLDDYYTKDEVDDLLDGKADKDDVYTKDETDDLLDDKLDASAYTPTDLSNYYTKEQSDERFLTEHQPLKTINGQVISGTGNIEIDCSGGTIDAYTKQESDAKYALKTDIPSLSGYATEQWVLDKHYITGVDLSNYALKSEIPTVPSNVSSFINDAGYVTDSALIQYITNLQEQLNSLIASISGCCGSSGETQYRWITETGENDYWCDGTTKKTMEKEQSSNDGLIWTDTGSERSGSTVLEYNCIDCGYTPVVSGTPRFFGTYSGDTTLIKVINNCSSTTENIIVGKVCWPQRLTIKPCSNTVDYTTLTGGTGDDRQISYLVTGLTNAITSNLFENTDITVANVFDGISSIESYAFANNSKLKTVNIKGYQEGTTTVSYPVIEDNEVVYELIPSDQMFVTSIGDYAFANCPELETISIYPINSVPTLGNNAFANCPNLAHIYVERDLVENFKTAQGWSTYANIIESAN